MYSNRYEELYHHGVKGQTWGVRKWQNPDGSLTPEGYLHYGYKMGKKYNKAMGSIDLAKARLAANKYYYDGSRRFYYIANKKRTAKKRIKDDNRAIKLANKYKEKAKQINEESKSKYGIDLTESIRKTKSQSHVHYYNKFNRTSTTFTNVYNDGKRYLNDAFNDKQRSKLLYSSNLFAQFRMDAHIWKMYYESGQPTKVQGKDN